MIQLFNINSHNIDTSEFSNLLHDDCVEEFEKKIADYVGAKYACSINSATNAIFLSMLEKPNLVQRKHVSVPSMIPPVVVNAILTSSIGNVLEFYDGGGLRYRGSAYHSSTKVHWYPRVRGESRRTE